MIDPNTMRWAVYDSWATYPEQAGRIKRSISVIVEAKRANTVCVIGAYEPTAEVYQASGMAVAARIVELHNSALAA